MKFNIALDWNRKEYYDHYSDVHNKWFNIMVQLDLSDIGSMWNNIKRNNFWGYVRAVSCVDHNIDLKDKIVLLNVYFPCIDIEIDLFWGKDV